MNLNFNDNIKTIISETKAMKVGFGICFLINAILYTIGIYFLIKYEICYWQFYFFIICAFIATTSLTNHFFNFMFTIPERIIKFKNFIKSKLGAIKDKKRYLEARFSYYDLLWNSFFSDIEKKFFIELVKKTH